MNTNEIIDAYKKNISKIEHINQLLNRNKSLFDKMQSQTITDISKLYSVVFKNINPDKKYVCDVDNAKLDEYSYNDDDDENDNIEKRKLFLNTEGFSFSGVFNPTRNEDVDTSKTIYITSFSQKGFLKMLLRLYYNKDKIISSINRDYKKSIAIRFFEALEKAECHKILDYNLDYDYFKIILPKTITLEYYNNLKMEPLEMNFILTKNANTSVTINKRRGWSNENNIQLNDLERVSQIYDELVDFLNKYYQHLDVQDKSLSNFYNILKDSFAKELVLNSLKDEETKNE